MPGIVARWQAKIKSRGSEGRGIPGEFVVDCNSVVAVMKWHTSSSPFFW